MLTTVEAIVERLVAGYAPDRIILFGSRATGTSRGDSDVDLLIVKETDRRPVDRRIEVERLLADRALPLDLIVYTPGELRQLFAAGSPLIEEVMEHGRVLYMRKATTAWLREAQELPSPHHLYWPDLDVDLAVESIETPDGSVHEDRHRQADGS